MKKVVVCLLCIINVHFVYGMEKEARKIARIVNFATYPKISLVQDDVYNRRTKGTDIIVIGEVEQGKLKDKNFNDYMCVGNLTCSQDNIIAIESPCNSSHGKNKTGQTVLELFKIKKKKDSCCSLTTKEMDNLIVYVTEPQLLPVETDSKNNVRYHYRVTRRLDEKTEQNEEYFGDKALYEAYKDLGICYSNALEKAHELCAQNHEVKSIALTLLSVSLGFSFEEVAEVANKAILEFIENGVNKDKYSLIELVVPTKEQLLHCIKLFDDKKIKCDGMTIEDGF